MAESTMIVNDSLNENLGIYDFTKWHRVQVGDNLHNYKMIYLAYLGGNNEIVNPTMIPIALLFIDPSKNDLSTVSFISGNTFCSVRWNSSGIVTAFANAATSCCYVF